MIFIDDTYLTALLVKNDENHDRAVELKDKLREKRVINDVVLLKTLENFTENGGVVSRDLIEFLVEANEFITLEVSNYQNCVKYYDLLKDFNACTIISTMYRNDVFQIASFNPVFDKIENITRIY